MAALKLAWEQTNGPYRAACASDSRVFALRRRELEAFDVATGKRLWAREGVRRIVLGSEHLLCLCFPRSASDGMNRWSLEALSLEGDVIWHETLTARSATRIFAAGRAKVWVTLARFGQFILEERREADGKLLREHQLNRSRAIVTGAKAWTRDDSGVSMLDLVTDQRHELRLEGHGPMTAERNDLYCVADNDICAVRDGELLWRYSVPTRDLSRIAALDGLPPDNNDDDVWEATPGRPTVWGDRLLVATLHGRLVCLDRQSGRLKWSIDSAHYPSSRRVSRPIGQSDHALWGASDETLNWVDREGTLLASVELPQPIETELVPAGRGTVLCMDRLAYYLPVHNVPAPQA